MKIIAISLLLTIASLGLADSGEAPPTEFNKDLLWDSHGPISVQKINLALQSDNVAEQKLAYLYIVGVLDSTEGVYWCNDPIKPIGPGGVKELATHALRKSFKKNPDDRAAFIIIEQFKKTSPCK